MMIGIVLLFLGLVLMVAINICTFYILPSSTALAVCVVLDFIFVAMVRPVQR